MLQRTSFHNNHITLSGLNSKVLGYDKYYGGSEFVFFGGVIFVISPVFKKGTEIQSENELTYNHVDYSKPGCYDGEAKDVVE
jgi:hypothetical protein